VFDSPQCPLFFVFCFCPISRQSRRRFPSYGRCDPSPSRKGECFDVMHKVSHARETSRGFGDFSPEKPREHASLGMLTHPASQKDRQTRLKSDGHLRRRMEKMYRAL
jgi:hypothetical protein